MAKDYKKILKEWALDIEAMLPQVNSMPERAKDAKTEVENSSKEISSNMSLTLAALNKALAGSIYALSDKEKESVSTYADSAVLAWNNIESTKTKMSQAGLSTIQIEESVEQTKLIFREAKLILKLIR